MRTILYAPLAVEGGEILRRSRDRRAVDEERQVRREVDAVIGPLMM
ncbi:MAG: hypothetical protein JSU86_14295 [Phycisphaerales bacterium]|nr:MAG: hypothetical protein JSU86_14295 [Phycisphaerales bacterium]